MRSVYEQIKTPYKHGVVFRHPDPNTMVDSPTIFREGNHWHMVYIAYDGQGYETWLAKSDNLLDWEIQGRIMSFTEDTWDANQKAGYLALVDIEWGGSYGVEKFDGKYWMSYLGGATQGYEAGTLGIGLAHSPTLTEVREWDRLEEPLMLPSDKDRRWFESATLYKSHIIHDAEKHTGHPFLMYYNAKGEEGFESIGMAVSDDMLNWQRHGKDPLITRREGICADAQIVKMDGIYVMFYFGAFWKPNAFERFACSHDLVNWTDWEGEDLVAPTEPYDKQYAHKPWVIRWRDTVYHFYNAVGDQGRVIALATSKPLG